jgi:thioredoxin reductase (NADPH)
LIRGDSLYKSMSSYLARRIEHTRNIQLNINTTIRRMRGDGHLDGVEVLHESTGQARLIETPAVFSFIGAVPRTEWLPPEIERDAVPVGDKPPRRVRGGGRSFGIRQARGSGRR